MYLTQMVLKLNHEVGKLGTVAATDSAWAIAPSYEILQILLLMTHYLKTSLPKIIFSKMKYNEKKYPIEFCKTSKYLDKYCTSIRTQNPNVAIAEKEFTLEIVADIVLKIDQRTLCFCFEGIIVQLEFFSKDRAFTHYNTIPNLLLALITEVGELSELLQWRNSDISHWELDMVKKKAICMEIADVAIYTMRLILAYDIVSDVRKALFSSSRGKREE